MKKEKPKSKPELKVSAPIYRLRLFVAGNEPNSGKAEKVALRLCEQHLKGRYEIQIVDVLEDYQAAIAEEVIAVPTLIVVTPTKKTVFVGTLNDEEKVLLAFDLSNKEAPL
jgi:circadian clock protein KaiB